MRHQILVFFKVISLELLVLNFLTGQDTQFVNGEILLKYIASVDINQRELFEKQEELLLIQELPRINVFQYKLPENVSVLEAVEYLNNDPKVEFAEPNYTRSPYFSTDPRYVNQWSLQNTGQLVNGVSGPVDVDIDWPEAMTMFTGFSEVIVAVIDSGVAILHPDLEAGSAVNNFDLPDGLDNDESGYIDDTFGWDFFDNDNNPFDENGHGTLVASIISAENNNNTGITGISPTARILPIRIFSDFGRGHIPILGISDLVFALNYALIRNARIINLSLGGFAFSNTEKLAFDLLDEAGILVIASAGNGGFDGIGDNNDLEPIYPASYTSPNIISVAALDRSGRLAYFSNHGANSVDIAAPGTDILGADITRETIFFEDFNSRAPGWISGNGPFNQSPYGWFPLGSPGNYALNDGSGLLYPYANNTDTSARSPFIDLSNSFGPQISFIAEYDLDYSFFPLSVDYVSLEFSFDGVFSWIPYYYLTLSSFDVSEQRIDISDLAGSSGYFRFRLVTDNIFGANGINGGGVLIDDFKITQVKAFESDNPQYQFLDGTSFSAPMVTGVASLIMSQAPFLTHHQVREIILQNTDYVSDLNGRIATSGRLNAHKALQAAASLNSEEGVVIAGYGTQVGFDIQHQLGNIYDQVLMTGPFVIIQADPNQITRVSFIDENDDIVQVEYSGNGALAIQIDLATYVGPETPEKYNQAIEYVKGRAVISIGSADSSSNLSIFTVGTVTAINNALFPPSTIYDAKADIASVAIVSSTSFGGIRCANAVFKNTKGFPGILAPNVSIESTLIIGDIDARGAGSPTLIIGKDSPLRASSGAIIISGGDLFQSNGRGIVVAGKTPGFQSIRSTDGLKSDGTSLVARAISANFETNNGETVIIPIENL